MEDKKSINDPQRAFVLIGSYDAKQLDDCPGYYVYPISNKKYSSFKDYESINEIRLLDKNQIYRTYNATFIGIKNHNELKCEFNYKRKDKIESNTYVVFKINKKINDSFLNNDLQKSVIRLGDFSNAPKIKNKLSNGFHFKRKKGSNVYYELLKEYSAEDLCVCEPNLQFQMEFSDISYGKSFKQDVPFPGPDKGDFTFIDLFAGIGGIRLGYQELGGKCVFSSEWDEEAAKTYFYNFGERPYGDINKIDPKDIPDFDVLLAGFPCQPFSIIGDKAGFEHETQGTLFFNIEEILKVKKPKAFMLENVRNLVAHDGGRTFKIILSHLKDAGYDVHYKVLNALDFGVPQKRERIIICGFYKPVDFEFPSPIPKENRKTVADIIDKDAESDESLKVKPEIRKSRLARLKNINFPKPYISHENVAGSITPHEYSCALRAGASANYILINDERRPSPREMLRIQGFPDEFKIVVKYGQIKHQTGNSVAVPMIRAVAKKLIEQLKKI